MKRSLFPTISVLALAAVFAVSSLQGNEPQVGYETYTSADGTSYFAVGLQVPAVPSESELDVVFLVDTSAKQRGQVRRDTLDTLRAAIDALPADASIQLIAMDVESEPLTATFAKKGSEELNTALATLTRRVPLGATDMAKGLDACQSAFAGQAGNARRAVVYLGDGGSMAKMVDPAVFESKVQEFVKQQIPFTACAVGVQTNLGLIGALANRTGGALIDMNAAVHDGLQSALERAEAAGENYVETPDFGLSVGQQLAQAAGATVVWPDQASVEFPAGWDVYPATLQPIRSDRATIIVGKTTADKIGPFTFDLKGESPDSAFELSWSLVPSGKVGANAANTYLGAVVEIAEKDQGATMPVVGWASMATIRDGFANNIDAQLDKAEMSITTGQLDQAKVFIEDVLAFDPNNAYAERLRTEVMAEFQKAAVAPTNPGVYQAFADDNGSAPSAVTAVPRSASMVDTVVREQGALVQKIQNEVKHTIADSAKRAGTDPQGAIQNLRLCLQSVRDNTALDPDVRNQMLDRIGITLRQVEEQKAIADARRLEIERNRAVEEARREELHSLDAAREKGVQIMKRFDALMNAGEYKVATHVATVAMDVIPDSTAPFVAQRTSELTAYITEYAELRYRRHLGFIDALFSAERSFIPISDEPPLLYQDPETWLLLSERRKERYSSVELSQHGPAERRINRALERNIDLDLDESSTFEDLINIIKDRNPGINIRIDDKGAGALGITSQSPVVRSPFTVHGIKLRSALKRILNEQDLTYCISDEMLLFTSIDEAKENRSIKVYPVGDLVVDPTPISGGMGGMMGGMGGMMNGMGMGGGGMGGGMGGMGGGMGGMGGGMGGMMGGGGGGGMWNIPTGRRPANGFNGMFNIPDEKDVPAQAKALAGAAMASTDAEAFWNQYFTKHEGDINDELVAETVRRLVELMKSNRNTDGTAEKNVIALVETAIMHDAVQGWMYEALALSLLKIGAPMKDLERAVLSAADFCNNPDDMMNLGLFLQGVGLKSRAFVMYQQALDMLAPQREYYSVVFRLAKELQEETDDSGPLRWTALAILSQEWDGIEGRELSQSALDSLTVLENRMRRAGLNELADGLVQEVRNARTRDCIVTVEWTGSAGIDISVSEPTGSYCWFNNPRSQAGGLITAPTAKAVGANAVVNRVSYICPKAFNGKYAVVVQKNWGELTNNSVKISIETGAFSGEESREGTSFTMSPEGVVVLFDLEQGRRTESLSEAQLQVASVRQSVAQQNLNRNAILERLNDAGVLAQVTSSGSANYAPVANGYRPVGPMPYPPYGASVVGYRPVITTIPDGASLFSNAVVSADRRYVRISPAPMFNSIRRVYSYSMSTGDLDDQTGQLGGGGGMSGMGFGGGGGGMGGMGGGMGGMGGGGGMW